MRVAVVSPGDEVIRLVECPEDGNERWTWMREQVDGDLDYNTLPAWTGRQWSGITQMVVNDWGLIRNLPANEIATRLYQWGWPPAGTAGHPGIAGVAVVVYESDQGMTESVPDSVVHDWILNGLRVSGL